MIAIAEGTLWAAVVAIAIGQANAMRNPVRWWQRGANLLIGVGAFWALLSVVQGTIPVVKEADALVLREAPGAIRVEMTAVKVRDCRRWIDTEVYVIDAAGNAVQAHVEWIGDKTPGNSRPPGMRHRFEPARVTFDPRLDARQVEFVSYHSCGWLWHDTRTSVGPWGIPQ